MARPYILAAHGADGVGRVQGGGGEAEIPGWRWAGWFGRTMARPYILAAHGAAGRWWVHGFLGCFLGDLLRNGEILGVGGIFFVKGL